MDFDQLYNKLKERFMPFLAVFFVAVFITYAFLVVIDFIPEPVSDENQTEAEEEVSWEEETQVVEENQLQPEAENAESEPEPVVTHANPKSIYIDKFDKEIKVLNPQSADIATLDEALLSGVIRHPESADFSEDGNMLILGHSSYLPNVLNKNFQAFNGIQELTWGDKVRLRSDDMEYVYRVDKVYEANTELFVPNTPGEAKLTLATCDVLGAKEDRFIVEASLIGSYSI